MIRQTDRQTDKRRSEEKVCSHSFRHGFGFLFAVAILAKLLYHVGERNVQILDKILHIRGDIGSKLGEPTRNRGTAVDIRRNFLSHDHFAKFV